MGGVQKEVWTGAGLKKGSNGGSEQKFGREKGSDRGWGEVVARRKI